VLRVTDSVTGGLLKIVHGHLRPKSFAASNKLQMRRMILIIVVRFLGVELDAQTDLITLVNDIAMTWDHPTNMEMDDTRYRRQVFVGGCYDFIRRVRRVGPGPEDDDVRKHGAIYERFLQPAQPV
jgi:hypothetical protein